MIQLHSDYLVFEVSGGDKIPCSVEDLTVEILSDSIHQVDPDVIRQAATAVLHYFKHDLHRESVTLDEFTEALEKVLIGLGFQIEGSAASSAAPAPGDVAEADLADIAAAAEHGLELGFYACLRLKMQSLMAGTPKVVRFHGLRRCAKRLARVRRWCPRSVQVSDEIVGFLRDCWGAQSPRSQSSLLVK